MKQYVVAICSLFQNKIKQYQVWGISEYDALKDAMLLFTDNDIYEQQWQGRPEYPENYDALVSSYMASDIIVSVIEIK